MKSMENLISSKEEQKYIKETKTKTETETQTLPLSSEV